MRQASAEAASVAMEKGPHLRGPPCTASPGVRRLAAPVLRRSETSARAWFGYRLGRRAGLVVAPEHDHAFLHLAGLFQFALERSEDDPGLFDIGEADAV